MEVKLPEGFFFFFSFFFFSFFFLTDINVTIALDSMKSCKNHLASLLLSRSNGATLDLLLTVVSTWPSDGSCSVIEPRCFCVYRQDCVHVWRQIFPHSLRRLHVPPTRHIQSCANVRSSITHYTTSCLGLIQSQSAPLTEWSPIQMTHLCCFGLVHFTLPQWQETTAVIWFPDTLITDFLPKRSPENISIIIQFSRPILTES